MPRAHLRVQNNTTASGSLNNQNRWDNFSFPGDLPFTLQSPKTRMPRIPQTSRSTCVSFVKICRQPTSSEFVDQSHVQLYKYLHSKLLILLWNVRSKYLSCGGI